MDKREQTRQIAARGVGIGGSAPVTVQSMCNTKTWDAEATLAQIRALRAAGCDIVRLAVPDVRSAEALEAIREGTDMPLVADIHFDYRLALMAAERGIDKIRINPGNIGGEEHVRAVADACRQRHIPIRIGVNAGSLEKQLLVKYGHPCAEAMIESAQTHARMLEKVGFEDICLSLKTSSVPLTIESYRLAAETFDYPLHLGVTETGTEYNGTIQSAVGIGTLLCEGIGNTIRVSLTADPVKEVLFARRILETIGMREKAIDVVSCPTCGRTEIDLIGLANEVESRLSGCKKNIKVAVMGCAVNGPGEAREADIGIAGGDGCALIFKKGEIICKVPESEAVATLLAEIEKL